MDFENLITYTEPIGLVIFFVSFMASSINTLFPCDLSILINHDIVRHIFSFMFIYGSIVLNISSTNSNSPTSTNTFISGIYRSILLYIWLLLLLHTTPLAIGAVLISIFLSFVAQRYETLRVQEGVSNKELDKIKWWRFTLQASAVVFTAMGLAANLILHPEARSLQAFFVKQCNRKKG
jgi:hypothetical protein